MPSNTAGVRLEALLLGRKGQGWAMFRLPSVLLPSPAGRLAEEGGRPGRLDLLEVPASWYCLS